MAGVERHRISNAVRVVADGERLVTDRGEVDLPPRRVVRVVQGDGHPTVEVQRGVEDESIFGSAGELLTLADVVTSRGVEHHLGDGLCRSDVGEEETGKREQKEQVTHGATSMWDCLIRGVACDCTNYHISSKMSIDEA